MGRHETIRLKKEVHGKGEKSETKKRGSERNRHSEEAFRHYKRFKAGKRGVTMQRIGDKQKRSGSKTRSIRGRKKEKINRRAGGTRMRKKH